MKLIFSTGWRLFLDTPGVMNLIGLWGLWMMILMISQCGVLSHVGSQFSSIKSSSTVIEKCSSSHPSSTPSDALLVGSEVIGQMG